MTFKNNMKIGRISEMRDVWSIHWRKLFINGTKDPHVYQLKFFLLFFFQGFVWHSIDAIIVKKYVSYVLILSIRSKISRKGKIEASIKRHIKVCIVAQPIFIQPMNERWAHCYIFIGGWSSLVCSLA